MTYFTFERRRLRRGELTFDGATPVGEVFPYKPWRERLSLDDRPTRYLAKLPSGRWLPGVFLARHDAAEALRAYRRCEECEQQVSA
jgi:hypothetical protein